MGVILPRVDWSGLGFSDGGGSRAAGAPHLGCPAPPGPARRGSLSEESQVDRREHRDDTDIDEKPGPGVVAEEEQIDDDHDEHERKDEQRDGRLAHGGLLCLGAPAWCLGSVARGRRRGDASSVAPAHGVPPSGSCGVADRVRRTGARRTAWGSTRRTAYGARGLAFAA